MRGYLAKLIRVSLLALATALEEVRHVAGVRDYRIDDEIYWRDMF